MATSEAAPRLPEVRPPPCSPCPAEGGQSDTRQGPSPNGNDGRAAHRAVLPQEEVQDASTETALPNPTSPGNPNLAWGGAALPVSPSSHTISEKLGSVQMEVQRLSQAVHVVLEKQCCLEQQQELQQWLQQEMLVILQQVSSTVSHGTVPANQPCLLFSGGAKPSPTMTNFSQFKVELL